ncbi:MAG: site-2 protease family protein, partial [Gaiellaceae bacterium]
MTERETEPREQYEPKDWSSLYEARDDDPALYERDYKPIHPQPAWRSLVRKLWAPIAAIAFLLWKLKFVFVAVFKFKIFTVAGSMLVSIAAYALLWGWQFAFGFVLLLLVHELGHVLEAKRQGLPVSAPMFIPFLGALITLKQLPDNAWAEAKVAIAGPIVGGLGAA